MSIADMYVKGYVKPSGEVAFTNGDGKVILRCFVDGKPKEALNRLRNLLDNLEAKC